MATSALGSVPLVSLRAGPSAEDAALCAAVPAGPGEVPTRTRSAPELLSCSLPTLFILSSFSVIASPLFLHEDSQIYLIYVSPCSCQASD